MKLYLLILILVAFSQPSLAQSSIATAMLPIQIGSLVFVASTDGNNEKRKESELQKQVKAKRTTLLKQVDELIRLEKLWATYELAMPFVKLSQTMKQLQAELSGKTFAKNILDRFGLLDLKQRYHAQLVMLDVIQSFVWFVEELHNLHRMEIRKGRTSFPEYSLTEEDYSNYELTQYNEAARRLVRRLHKEGLYDPKNTRHRGWAITNREDPRLTQKETELLMDFRDEAWGIGDFDEEEHPLDGKDKEAISERADWIYSIHHLIIFKAHHFSKTESNS